MLSTFHQRSATQTGRCGLRHFRARGRSFWSRFASALLCALFLWPMLAPISIFASSGAQASCCCKGTCHCRYCKRHHRNAPPGDFSPVFDAPSDQCPCSPDLQLPISSARFALVSAPLPTAQISAHPAGVPQTEARLRFTSIRVRQKRGPPALSPTAEL